MRILVISNLGPTPHNPWGGVFIPPRVRGLVRAGNEVTLVLPVISSPSTPFVNSVRKIPPPSTTPALHRNADSPDSVPWLPLPLAVPEWSRWGGLLGFPEPLMRRLSRDLLDSLPVAGYDLVQAHGMYEFWAGGLAREVARSLGIPFAVTLHGSDVNGLLPWRRRAFRRVANDAVGMFFVSDALRQTAVGQGLVPGPSAVAPNGIEGAVFNASGRTSAKQLRVLFVGALASVKGADRIPEVFSSIRADEPGARLHVVGDGPLGKRLQRQLGQVDAQFTGHIPPVAVADEMRDCDVLIIPSRSEGWPCVVLEAQACGARVVSTAVGGLPEAIGPGGETTSAEPFDPSHMALAVLRQWRRSDVTMIEERAQTFDWTALAREELARITEWST